MACMWISTAKAVYLQLTHEIRVCWQTVQIRPYLQVWVGHQPLHHSNSMREVTEDIVNMSHKIGYWWLEQQILPIATQQQRNVNPRMLVLAQGNGT